MPGEQTVNVPKLHPDTTAAAADQQHNTTRSSVIVAVADDAIGRRRRRHQRAAALGSRLTARHDATQRHDQSRTLKRQTFGRLAGATTHQPERGTLGEDWRRRASLCHLRRRSTVRIGQPRVLSDRRAAPVPLPPSRAHGAHTERSWRSVRLAAWR